MTHVVLNMIYSLPANRFTKVIAKVLRQIIVPRDSRVIDVVFKGLALRLRSSGNLCEKKHLFLPQFFDQAELDACIDGLPHSGVFLDVGANIGLYSTRVAYARGDDVRVIAVEPDPELVARFRFNLSANKIENVEICPVALGDKRGTAELMLSESQRGRNRLRQGSEVEQARDTGIQVPTMPLLELCAQQSIKRIDVLKIDVEGFEDKVLRPFFDAAPQPLWPSRIVIEFEHDTARLIEWLQDTCGYEPLFRTQRNLLLTLPRSMTRVGTAATAHTS